jgi:hypothetical protein
MNDKSARKFIERNLKAKGIEAPPTGYSTTSGYYSNSITEDRMM